VPRMQWTLLNSSERLLELLRRCHADQDGPNRRVRDRKPRAALAANPSFTGGNRQRARATLAS
jgi:hypothetical protein